MPNERNLTIAELASNTGANRNTLKVGLLELVADRRRRCHGKARAATKVEWGIGLLSGLSAPSGLR